MTTDQLEKGDSLKKKIDDLKSRITAAKAVRDNESQMKTCSLNIEAYLTNGEGHRYDKTNTFGTSNSLPDEMKQKIVEEILDCSTRIVRIFEKEIKRLEKEFETL